jgi:hypothetical protein
MIHYKRRYKIILAAISVDTATFPAGPFLPFQLNAIYADESETSTEQGLSQEKA